MRTYYKIVGNYLNGHLFTALVAEEDKDNFLTSCSQALSDGSPLDINTLTIEEVIKDNSNG